MSKRKSRQFRGKRCLNCETALDISEKYCHQCGQLNSTKKLTIADFFEEFLSNFYAYDSRLKNSIVSIFTKPGILAKEFNEGKRQKYANPFRLFLSVSIVLFIVMNINNKKENISNALNDQKTEQEINSEKRTDSLQLDLIATKLDIDVTSQKKKTIFYKDSIYTKKQLEADESQIQYTITSFRNFHIKYPEKSTEKSLIELGFENDFSNRLLFDKAKVFKSNEIGAEILDYFFQKLPLLIFVSLPILTLMFWLVFYSKSKNYTEHLVFTYTFYTFLFLGMILFDLIELFSPNISVFVKKVSYSLLFPIYLYKSLRNFYQSSRWKTVFKFILLNILFMPFIFICVAFILFLATIFF